MIHHGEHREHGEGEWVDCDPSVIDRVLTCATRVHSTLGAGLMESVYEAALYLELVEHGIPVLRQVEVPVFYRGRELGIGFRADLVVDNSLLLELKSVKSLDDTHLAQVLTYLRLLRFRRGYLLNFNVPLLKQGIRRVSL